MSRHGAGTSSSQKQDMYTLEILPIKTLEYIFSFLWFRDISSISSTTRSMNSLVKCERFGLHMLIQISSYLFRNPSLMNQTAEWTSMLAGVFSNLSASPFLRIPSVDTNADETTIYNSSTHTANASSTSINTCDFLLLARRLSSWPTKIDASSLIQVPRNVKILCSDDYPDSLCAVYGGRRKESHKGYAVVTTDDHFPCLPGTFTQPRHRNEGEMQAWERMPRVELQKTKKESVVCRTMAPFTRLVLVPVWNGGAGRVPASDFPSPTTPTSTTLLPPDQPPEPPTYQKLASLSCIAYFEVCVHPNQGYSAMDDIRRFSVGLACSLFPLRKKQLGFDNYSFGYHRAGHFVHGNRRVAHMPAYSPGDIVGCGVIYPPLTGAITSGKIFFTKNGDVVGVFDMGVEGLLSLPWFPALVSILHVPFLYLTHIHTHTIF